MNLQLAYLGRSAIQQTPLGLAVSLAPNLRRDRVGFNGTLRQPLRFREAVSALHNIVVSDLRYQPKDRSAYQAFLAEQKERETTLRRGVSQAVRAELRSRQPEPMPTGLEQRFQKLRKTYWDARLKYSDYLWRHDPELWRRLVPCDPVIVEYVGQTYHVAVGPRGLPQGACTSPALSNQVARRLDRRLRGLSDKLGLTYTRYADDLTFSGDDSFKGRVGYLMARVRHIAEEEGYAVNEKKSRVLRLRAILHRARTEGLERQNREGRSNFVAWLQGKIAYVRMSRPDIGAKLHAQLQQILQRGLS